MGGVIGGLFHLAWHFGVTVPSFSNVLWEWGDLFDKVPRLELIGFHVLVLVAHVVVYAVLGALLGSLVQISRRVG